MKRVSNKIQILQENGQLKEVENSKIITLSKEDRLEMKINLYEIKDKNLNKKIEMLSY